MSHDLALYAINHNRHLTMTSRNARSDWVSRAGLQSLQATLEIIVNSKLLPLVGEIVCAHICANPVATQDLSTLITVVYASLSRLNGPAAAPEKALVPALSLRASVSPESIACLECGARFKSLKRHIASHGLNADQYRAKWSLPESYAMVSANYSAVRSAMARESGLGRKAAA